MIDVVDYGDDESGTGAEPADREDSNDEDESPKQRRGRDDDDDRYERRPARPQSDRIDYGRIGEEIARRLQPSPTQRQRELVAERAYNELVSEGIDPRAIDRIFKVVHATLADKEAEWGQRNQQAEQKAKTESISQRSWDDCEEAVSAFEPVMPALKRNEYARQGVMAMVSDIFKTDPKFREHMEERAHEGKTPSKSVMAAAVKKAVKKYAADHDIKLQDAKPDLNLRSTKAAGEAAPQDEEAILRSLNGRQLAFYRALKNANVPQKRALQRAKEHGNG